MKSPDGKVENNFSIFIPMNKVKILAFIVFAAMLAACGPDDGSPPSLKNNGDMNFISPFDTIVAEFNSKIVNIDKLNEGNIKYSQPMKMIIYNTTSNRLYFVGISDTASCGLTHLKPKSNRRDSIVFSNLRNEDNYVQKNAVLKFFTYPIFDSDNNDVSNPDDLKNLRLSGVITDSTTDEVTFAGTIGLNPDTSPEWIDLNDYFKLSLKAYDSLYVRLSNAKNNEANLSIVFPLISNRDSTIVATVDGKTKYIAYKMDPEFIDVPDRDTPVEFKIRVSHTGTLTPYLLWVKIVEKKR